MKRRMIVTGMAAAAVAAGLYRFTDLLVRHYPPTPYDDLLTRLTNREQAVKLGAQVGGSFNAASQAAQLRTELGDKSLGQVAASDIAGGRMVEVGGWIVPRTVAQLSALAAKA